MIFLAPQESLAPGATFRPNINVVVTDGDAGLADVVTTSRKELQLLAGCRRTVDAPVTLADGTAAHQIGGTFTFGDNALCNAHHSRECAFRAAAALQQPVRSVAA